MAAVPDPPADASTTPNPAIHATRSGFPTPPTSWETDEASAALSALSGPRRLGSPECAAQETTGGTGEWAAAEPAVPQFSRSVGRLIACRLAPQRLGSSGEGAGDSVEESSGGSIHSSGFLSPQSSPQSSPHSDLRPKPMTPVPGGDPVKIDPIRRIETMSWFHFPLPNLQPPHCQTKEYWWLPCTKDLPRIAHLHHPPPTTSPGTKSVTFIHPSQITDSIRRMRSHTATPAISRRWSSTGLDGPPPPEPERSTSSRRRIVATDSGADALSAVRAKLTRQGSQRGTPTIVTLRRASAVLDTIAQRQVFATDDLTTALALHTNRGGMQDKVPMAYVVMREEIKVLQSPKQKKAAHGLPTGGKTAKAINGARLAPRPRLAADVALTVADVHAHVRFSRSRPRRWRVTSHRSCVITTGRKRSVHEIVWEKDGRPQEVRSRSEAWSLSPRPDQPGRSMRRMMWPKSVSRSEPNRWEGRTRDSGGGGVVSFPPLVDGGGEEEREQRTLYHFGVDATRGFAAVAVSL
jgi:hypothetical protein